MQQPPRRPRPPPLVTESIDQANMHELNCQIYRSVRSCDTCTYIVCRDMIIMLRGDGSMLDGGRRRSKWMEDWSLS
jgi:hypothetical protein